ncbi:dihydroxy-acid dehydratase [Paracoccus ravus]|uniref:dihydroxy-acid dehydratase domain-containing protein n=1 Tax=Paracoccus ravus TaxID=2447760 RepID=UPI00106E0ABB|nr:dihydroxy-acid dehydratase [Paracoccus ravus]
MQNTKANKRFRSQQWFDDPNNPGMTALTPRDVLTWEASENAIIVHAAVGGSTNAPPHLQAIAPHAGGAPAVMDELKRAGLLQEKAMTVTGQRMGQNLIGWESQDQSVIRSYDKSQRENAGFIVLSGNLFDSAPMKTSVISADFRQRFQSEPGNEGVQDAPAIVFEGPEDYHERIIDPPLANDDQSIPFIRNVGCVGYPGSAEVVNMQPPEALNVSPGSAVGGGLAYLKTGDRVRLDLSAGRMDALVDEAEWQARRDACTPPLRECQTPWEEIYCKEVGQLAQGGCLELARQSLT